jgi:hypothetical protein
VSPRVSQRRKYRLQGEELTEFEAYDLLMSISSESFQLMFGYFSIVSAFLIMSFFVADKLSTPHSYILLILFTLSSAFLVINFYALNVDLDNLYREMLSKKEQGIYELEWFGGNPVWVPVTLTYLQTLVGLGGYACSVAFFYFKRMSGGNQGSGQL